MQETPSLAPPRRSRRRRMCFAVVTLLLCALAAELGLRGLCAVWPQLDARLTGRVHAAARCVDDEQLGIRLTKTHAQHDELGFRNEAVPAECALVALGDSQTYGTNVSTSDAWPQQLAAMTRHSVYNMGTPGHGPTQSLQLLDVALARAPRMVVVTLYAGNDLYDCYESIQHRGLPRGLANEDPTVRQLLAELDQRAPLEERIEAEFARVFGDRSRREAARLAQRVRLIGLLDASWRRLRGRPARRTPEAVRASAAAHPGQLLVEIDMLPTTLTPDYRLAALDLDDPRLEDGLRIALDAVAVIAARVRRAGARCALLLIPTKELVFAEAARDAGADNGPLRRLLEHEQRVRDAARERCADLALICIDPLPALRESLDRGVQPYPITADGHPNQNGHRAIASAVAAALGPTLTGR